MRISSLYGSSLVVLALVALLTGHQSSTLAQQAPASGDVAVRGRVLATDGDAVPLRGARITVVASGGRPATVASDHEGWFQIPVPARGAWSLRVTKAGFAPGTLSAQDLTAGGPAVIHLARGAAVGGLLVDANGQPLSGVTVTVRPAACPEPCQQPSPPAPTTPVAGASADTDDLGEFRVGSLPAGQYDVHVPRGLTAVLPQAGTFITQALQQRRDAIEPGIAVLPPDATAPSPADQERIAATLQALRERLDATGTLDAAQSPAPDATVTLRSGEDVSLDLVVNADVSAASLTAGVRTGLLADIAQRATAQPARQERPGAVRGRITGPTGRPVSGAVVRLEPLAASASRSAVSTADGQYDIATVPPGAYRLVVSRSGLMPVEYGQQRTTQQGATLTVREGEILDRIDVSLPPGGAITGRLFDVYGEPLEGVSVQVLERRAAGGRFELTPVSGVLERRTDDRGYYRVHGLLPGTYYVVADDKTAVTQFVVSSLGTQFVVSSQGSPAAAESGRGAAARGLLTALTPDRVAQMAGMVAGDVGRSSPAIFYPGTVSPADAIPVRIEPGLDGFGIDIAFVSTDVGRIQGTAVDASGQPARGSITLTTSRRSGAIALPARTTSLDANGTFEFLHVPPGEYVVQTEPIGEALMVLASGARAGRTTDGARGRAAGAFLQSRSEFGTAFVAVNGADTAAVSIRTSPPAQVAGRVVADRDDGTFSPSGLTIGVVPADLDRAPAGLRARTSPRADGSFSLSGLSGPLRFELVQAPAGWYLKSAMVDGVDAADDPVTFGAGGQHGEMVIVLGRGAEITSRVTNERGERTADCAVVVFSTDQAHWYDRSRYLKMARPNQDGEISVTALPAGEYWIAAVHGLSSGEWQHPDVLRSLMIGARRVRVDDGQRATTDLRLMRVGSH